MNQPDLFVEPKPYVNGRSGISRSCSQAGAQQEEQEDLTRNEQTELIHTIQPPRGRTE